MTSLIDIKIVHNGSVFEEYCIHEDISEKTLLDISNDQREYFNDRCPKPFTVEVTFNA